MRYIGPTFEQQRTEGTNIRKNNKISSIKIIIRIIIIIIIISGPKKPYTADTRMTLAKNM
jgi:hypothetical protein